MAKKILVAYFSATGTTKRAAERIASVAGAELFEIVPETPYTKADLNWMDKHSRSSVEMNDRSSRPAIAKKLDNMADYDVIAVGFPIWWYREPSIIDTFMESYDFSGKAVTCFATSGGSGLGDSAKNLQALAPNAKVTDGKMAKRLSDDEIKSWLGSL